MMNREQAEAGALELFPDVKLPSDELWSEVINDRHQQYRKAYLQCFDDMQKEMDELRQASSKVVGIWRGNSETTSDLIEALSELEETLSK